MVLLIFPLIKKALLRGVGSNSHLQHLQPRTLSWSVGPSPVHGDSCLCSASGMWLLLFQLQVQPLAKLHTHAYGDTAGHTGCHRQGGSNAFTKHKPVSQVPSSSSAGRDRRSLVRAHTRLRASPGPSAAPLSTQHPCPHPGPCSPPRIPSRAAGPARGLR